MSDLKRLIDNFQTAKVLLVGDIMLDSFVYGGVSRISPEGPIPVLSVTREDKMLGGAGNVFANLRSLKVPAEVVSVIGCDAAGQQIINLVQSQGGDIDGLVQNNDRPTILKTRYLAQNQQLLRVDHENSSVLEAPILDRIYDAVEIKISAAKVLVLSDYGKGLLSADLVKRLMKLAKKHKVPVIVDPKAKDFSLYKGAMLITPNKKELSEATAGMKVATDQEIEAAAQALIKQSGVDNIMATRSEDGISIVTKKGPALHLKTKAREVYDVSGAGDTVVAVTAAALAAGGSLEEAAHLSNLAGGLVVAKVGTATVRPAELIAALEQEEENLHGHNHIAPIVDKDAAREMIRKWQAQGLTVGFTNGCFDILHYGHVNYLNQARGKCDRLVLGLNNDRSVKILKGANRPINDEMARATVMAALGSVDMVVFFGAEKAEQDNTPAPLLAVLKPDILMKGGDYTVDQLPEAKVILGYGGRVEIMPLYEGYSTTNIIKKSKTEAA